MLNLRYRTKKCEQNSKFKLQIILKTVIISIFAQDDKFVFTKWLKYWQ